MTLLATLITPPFLGGPAAGVVVWSQLTVLAFWFVLMALVGSLLGILHERARTTPKAAVGESSPESDESESRMDRQIDHAA